MSAMTQAAATRTLDLIEKAQGLLYEAAQVSCPLQGWAEQWQKIGDHADATKALWHSVNDAHRPSAHDNERATEESSVAGHNEPRDIPRPS